MRAAMRGDSSLEASGWMAGVETGAVGSFFTAQATPVAGFLGQ
jgi:hypothetical protein